MAEILQVIIALVALLIVAGAGFGIGLFLGGKAALRQMKDICCYTCREKLAEVTGDKLNND